MLVKAAETHIDPRMRRTRQMLQQALMELMREKSFQSITVQDIAARATVNRATFYDHFVDKFALLEYAIRDMFTAQLNSRLHGADSLSLDTLRNVIITICEAMAEGHRHCKPVDDQLLQQIESQMTAHLYEILHAWLVEAQIEDVAQPVSPELAAHLLAWAIYGAARFWQGSKHKQPAADFAEEILPIITASLHHSFRLEDQAGAH
jgi:AcrR family transcriptional regulator